MATYKAAFTLRLKDRVLDKLSIIASRNKRSRNAQIEVILEQYLIEYERRNGEIKLPY